MFIVFHVADFPLQAALRLPVSKGTATEETALSLDPAAPVGSDRWADRDCRPGAPSGRAPPLADPNAYLTQPAALFTGATKKSVALAVNAPARAAGVSPGMSAPQAIARCAALLIRTPVPAAEADARAALLAAALLVSPHAEDTGPGLVTLDAHGLAPAARIRACQAALTRLAPLGLHATAGLARTPLLALYAAKNRSRCPESREEENEERERVPGILAIPTDPAVESSFLAPLPLAAAEPNPELAGVLHTWGLRTFGDFTRLSRDDIGRRLGAAGVALWDRARGGEPRPLHLVAPPQHFVAAQEFEDAFETLDPLLFVLRRFLDRLTLELEAAHVVAVEIDLALTLEDESFYQRSFRLPEPTRDAAILFRTLHTHLESLRTDAAIVALRLRLTPARPLVRQQGLFETGLRDPHGFAETLARVATLLGADRVGTPVPEDTHRPDAVKLVPPLGAVPPAAAPTTHALTGRPLRRFRPPLPARFEMSEGQPSFLWTERVQGEIAEQHGPWFSSGEWWQADRTWARAEWDIALAQGGLYRLFRTAEGWFLEGEYD